MGDHIDLDRLQSLHEAASESQWPKWKFSDFPLTDCRLAVGARNALPALIAELRGLRAERDNLVKINRLLRDRPDLGDRARSVDAMIHENAQLRAERDRVEAALREMCAKLLEGESMKLPEGRRNPCDIFSTLMKLHGLWREPQPKETP